MSDNSGEKTGRYELTVKAVVLGVVLSVVLSSANAYLGLYAGMTVSASIPAAVLSMVILRFFRQSNLLENNLVQTAASAGEAVAAGAIFTLPALIIMGSWSSLGYWEGTALVGIGGLIGVIFSVPLRRALILETDLKFPEGIATAEVLRSGATESSSDGSSDRNRGFGRLVTAGVVGGLAKFMQSGMNLWVGSLQGGFRLGGTLFASGLSLSPALLGVGYIVGIRIALMVALGGALGWVVGLPAVGWHYGVPEGPAFGAAMTLWSEKIRYVGVGAMVLGGLWSLVSLVDPIKEAVTSGFDAYRGLFADGAESLDRSEKDLPVPLLLPVLISLVVPLFWLLGLTAEPGWTIVLVVVIITGLGFVFSAVAGYMAGLVGSSNNPVSGVTIATILGISLLLLALLGPEGSGPAAIAILCGSVVACAAAISGDTMQDLKAGHDVGATPWKQQVMEFVGVLSAAFVVVPIIDLLNRRYGIGPPTTANPESLPAPQATLMAGVADGVFSKGLPWDLIVAGLVTAALIVVLDEVLKRATAWGRAHVLAVAVGLYLPVQLTGTIFLGGIVAWSVTRIGSSRSAGRSGDGILAASGLITGEALVGILLALPVVLSGIHPMIHSRMFKAFETPPITGTVFGVLCLGWFAWYLRRAGAASE